MSTHPHTLTHTHTLPRSLLCAHRFDEALKLYEQVLEATPTNAAVWKRKVAVYKAQGRSVDAIKELTSLLEVYVLQVV